MSDDRKTPRAILLLAVLAALAACGSNIGSDNAAAPAPEPDAAPEAPRFEGTLPIELARYFTGDHTLYDGLPETFPPFTVPDSLQVLGGGERGNGQSLVFTSALSGQEAYDALSRAFLSQGGWQTLENPPLGPRNQVFALASQPASGGVPRDDLCHDGHGSLHILSDWPEAGVHTLSLTRPDARAPGSWCQQQAQRRAGFGRAGRSEAFDLLPSLRLPGDEMNRSGGGGGGSSEDYNARVQLALEGQSPEELESLLAGQLEAQGWQREAEWRGEFSTGSQWRRSPEPDRQVAGILDIVELGEDEFDVSFRMVRVPGD